MGTPERTVASIVEHLFTHPNPTTGGGPPAHIAWVVFENGTVFMSYPTDELPLSADQDALRAAALAALAELGSVQAGTSSADFSATHLRDWFPGEFVYWIRYDHPSVATIVIASEADDLAAGLHGRACRAADQESQVIVHIRPFQ
jgi:hypothetical protein